MRPLSQILLLSITAALTLPSLAAEDFCGHCGKNQLPAPIHPKPGRKFARDRFVDLLHLKLDVKPDFARRTVSVETTWKFKPIAKPLSQLTLDAVGLSIESVSATGAQVAEYQNAEEQLIITFAKPIAQAAEVTLVIKHHVEPENGLYFRTTEMGYKAGDTQLWTQGEAEMHRYWFPCYDYPNERFTSEVICHVPEGMEVVSNGHLVSQTKDAQGLQAHHWLQDKPHVNYLVALAAGYFYKIEDKAGPLPLAVLVPPSEKDQAANAFLDTRKIIEFYQREIGVPFAWDKYYQVFCHDFLAGGMENTSCTFEASSMLFKSETEELDTLHRLDAHETAHQWFGDLVTCRDWSHLWLNEGFASFYTILYEEQKNGHDAMLYSLWREAQKVLSQTDTKPTVWRDYGDAMEQFDYRVYPKGAWILHMIRSRLGPDLYRTAIKTYLERHRSQAVGSDDLQDVLEEISGLSFDQFFDQWLYHGGVPELDVSYSWDAASKLAKVSVRQTQKLSEKVRLFGVDLPVRFIVKGDSQDFKMRVSAATEDFHFALAEAPELVRIDPDYTLLVKVKFKPPGDMLKRQLTNKNDVIGRMIAVASLGKNDNHASIEQLKGVLNSDAFYGVRQESAKALKKIGNPEARAALVASLKQPDARVRDEVVQALAAYPHNEARDSLWTQAQTEKNPKILAAIVRSWGARPGETVISAALFGHLASRTYREVSATAAIAALRSQDDASAVSMIIEKLKAASKNFESASYSAALDAVAFLARNDKDRSSTRNFLTNHLSDPKQSIRTAAAKALGSLRDPAAIAMLEPLTQVTKPYNDPTREAAEQSLQALRALETGPAALKELWTELRKTQTESAALKKQVEGLKEKAAAVKK